MLASKPRALVIAPGRTSAEIAAAKAALSALDVSVARSADDACRLVAHRCPEVVVVDISAAPAATDVAARVRTAHAGSHRAPRVVEASIDDATLPDHALEVARLERAERAAADDAQRLHAAHALGGTVQWQHDPEVRSFAWLPGGSARFEGLHGEGNVADRFLRFVHPQDRARVEHALVNGTPGPIEYRIVLPGGEQREVFQQLHERRDPRSGRRVTLGTVQDVTAERQRQRTLELVAHYDAATGLPNRAHVSAYLQAALDTAACRSASVVILSVGVDAFRTIEDTFGRSVSEAVLREVAARLQSSLADGSPGHRESNGLVARHGAHELLVVLRDASAEDAAAFFQHATARLASPIALPRTPIVVTCSAGVVVADGPSAAEAETLLVHADAALHAAMTEGRAQLVIHAQKMRETLERKRVVEQRLRESLDTGKGLELHYQPKVATHSGRVRAVEALLRSSPDPRGPISPLELVAVAEDCGLIHALGDFVLRTACEQACQWARDEARPLRVAVNVSAHQLARAGFVDHVASVLAETGLSPELLELEITEGAMMTDIEGARVLLASLKRLGVHIALDDFGTGYSSFAYLTRLPIDTLKIDRSFVVEIGISAKGEAILGAILALSKSLGLAVVAEGVETPAQEAFLAGHGDLEIQGWLHSKALPARDLLAWLERREQL